ncbi:filamentous hemagglutinin family outer membrane protein [Calothrix parasitica NIES-267]|uniref:Filamentous hemagglutinin family outer membrane protein n=1 Tax=Calothrix parasitica NIES-267 TaxID=1973488 RepID=A0A1Z4LQU8_9CYAN|nr:filamentous hemagglutinin family outer membrane protein [Calothrix parasitica NIES-267]
MKGITFISGLIGGFLTSVIVLPAPAQVTSDNTTNTTVTNNGNNFNILNGIQKGNNLFHSFKEFSIPTGASATFNNSTDIVNIINRVTGGNISNIDGLIKSQGNANLFLINPAGIVFGENARLNIGGSFLGSTAESILFEDGFEFSAVNAQSEPLLTVSVPLGLQMGTNPGAIEVQGTGHNLQLITTKQSFPPFTRETNPRGLMLQPGKTLALVGSGISLQGGQLRADNGRVELGSVGIGKVKLNPVDSGFALSYAGVSEFRDIELKQKALLDASGSLGNDGIHISGRQVRLMGGAAGLVQNASSSLQGGQIVVNASELVELTGTTTDKKFRSNFTTETTTTGASGEIKISTKDLIFREGGQFVSRTFAQGAAGNMTLNASDSIQFLGISSINPRFQSSIFANSGGSATGKAGDVTLSTERLIATDGAIISNASFSSGNGGALKINADFVDISGVDPVFQGPTDIRFGSFRGGNGGSLILNARRVNVRDGARINGTTIGKGNAANLTINASESLDINGGIVTSSASFPDFRSTLNGFNTDPTGKAGTIAIKTNRLTVRNDGTVTVQNRGPANAGKLQIDATSIKLDNNGLLSASTALGEGGNVQIDARDVVLRRNSLINAEAGGTGSGGNITINSPIIAGLENSDIIANAVAGNGGNINITTQGIFGLEFRDELTEKSDITASSQFGVNGTVEINNLAIDPSSGLVELSATLSDSSQQIASGCSSNTGNTFVSTGRGGIAKNPNEAVDTNNTWSDIRDLSAFRKRNNNIQATQISNKPAIVEATGFIRNQDGEIELVAMEDKSNISNSKIDCRGYST